MTFLSAAPSRGLEPVGAQRPGSSTGRPRTWRSAAQLGCRREPEEEETVPEPVLRVTLIGGPTALLEYAGLRLLTDPTFDPPGHFGEAPAPEVDKLAGPSLSADEVGEVDAVLLSHDHHPDNLDVSGRAYLPRAGQVLTTVVGAERLGGNAVGLEPWASTRVGAVTVTAVPAQHGPDGTEEVLGPVIGFVLTADGLPTVYVSGDNAAVDVARAIVERLGRMELAVLFAGGANLPQFFGEALLTLGSGEAVEVAKAIGARAVVPIHQEGWSHFSHAPERLRRAFEEAGLADRLVPVDPGGTVTV
jgi:L-ascorbate metabolism protein UlaG (beta-lactamase superfamily)